MFTEGSICHRGEVNTAHKVELFVVLYFKETEGGWGQGKCSMATYS